MLNEEVYEELEQVFDAHYIDEEVEDVLLTLAESLQDLGIMGKEVTYKEKVGDINLEICGVCEDDDSVYVKWLKAGNKEYEIEDYML